MSNMSFEDALRADGPAPITKPHEIAEGMIGLRAWVKIPDRLRVRVMDGRLVVDMLPNTVFDAMSMLDELQGNISRASKASKA